MERMNKPREAGQNYQRALTLDANNAAARQGAARVSGGGGLLPL
jgi:hypothetical protein